MKVPRRAPSILLLSLLSLGPASCEGTKAAAQRESGAELAVPSSRDSLQLFLSGIPDLLERTRVPGISLAIIRDWGLEWSGSFGVVSASTGQAVTETTLFEAASLSKALCAYATLRMVDRGELQLDDPLVGYIPDSVLAREFLGEGFDDPRIREITARMVLTHSSGFPNWRGDGPLRFIHPPGQRFSYSGEGFIFLQNVLEELCQCDYADLMDREILHPLHMADSDFRWLPEYQDRIAQRHDEAGEVARQPAPREVHAAGTLLTTAEDYGRFLLALMEGTGLSSAAEEEFFRTQFRFPGRHGSEISWGLSVGLNENEGARAFWHHGDNRTAKAFFLAMPERGAAVVYFANGENGLAFVEEIVQGALGSDDPVQPFRAWTHYPRMGG
jgi:CubicO group peptidase (beta-lactamase class C family)